MPTYETRWIRCLSSGSSLGRQFLPGLKSWVSLSREPYEADPCIADSKKDLCKRSSRG